MVAVASVLRRSPLNKALYFLGGFVYCFSKTYKIENELRISEQRKAFKKLVVFMKDNLVISFAIASGYISYCGFASLMVIFSIENINLFDYVVPSDFIFGLFAIKSSPWLLLALLVFLILAFYSYCNCVWSHVRSVFVLSGIYLLAAPWCVGMLYGKIIVCDPSNHDYSVYHKGPNNRVDHGLYLVASLSNYKVFKTVSIGCHTPISAATEQDGFRVLAIHDSSIEKIEYTYGKI
ncbi:hypothetical protein [Vibrio parahaemolyticus]|uniref:hypothetical protein n=1 Tax=Vibrio parahaemolyticus TaxID=670 RepID=UPI0030811749